MYILLTTLLLFALYLAMLMPRCSRRKELLALDRTDFAHRGCFSSKKSVPENSLPAFHNAVKRGVGIELDVHLTSDGQIVVFHDDNLGRMCGTNRTIEECTYMELQDLHLQNTPERIPLFKDILSYVNGRVPILIEVKLTGKDTTLCRLLAEMLLNYHGTYMIQSFNTLVLFWFRRHAPQVLRGQLSSNLMHKKAKQQFLFCFLSRYLLLNFLGKPDFISYKLKDVHIPSLFILQHLFHVPIAVWTLRTKKDYDYAKQHYHLKIFENFEENY